MGEEILNLIPDHEPDHECVLKESRIPRVTWRGYAFEDVYGMRCQTCGYTALPPSTIAQIYVEISRMQREAENSNG